MMYFLRFSVLFLLFLYASALFGQVQNPGDDALFREFEVTSIRITMSAADKTFLLAEENRYAEIYVPTNITFKNSQLSDVAVNNVGVRLRGNTARGGSKRSYKIDFREYGGEKFKSYKKINLKPNGNDPTMVRELLSMHVYRQMGVPAARTAPARLYINEEFMGTYLMVEVIDDEFIDKRYGHEEGFLYKCAYGSTLQDNGQVLNGNLFETEINEELDTRAELEVFVDKLNNTSSVNFPTVIEQYFNVNLYLKQLAVEAILGHWDGYSYNKNNFYLYYNGQSRLFEFIPYDTDNTWGIDWVGQDWGTFDLESFYNANDPRPLTTRILAVPAYKNLYLAYLGSLMNTTFRPDYLHPLFDQLESLLDPWVAQDTYFDDSFGFTYTFFKNSFDYSNSGHVKYGLRGYLEMRRSAAEEYVTSISGRSDAYSVYPNPSNLPSFNVTSKSPIDDLQVSDLHGRWVSVFLNQSDLDRWTITLPDGKPGLYFIQIADTTTKWLYR